MAQLGIDSKTTPHFTRHTCVSMLADAGVTPTIIKKIVGHSGAMSVTESVYTHLDIKVLVDAVNKITP
ncbi:MAG: tyrosine-type recombinase/integrase [Ruminococcus sp.]|nr:tyrosine-type recombinase/integrase [Ruminococcus sp.]MBR4023269.1 tyrosine-type recombinase/integrase [Ruminococcus sp.]